MQPLVSIHQCLFGYADGHRLLASSMKLSDEALSQLLALTDLAPGLSPTAAPNYWTGAPIVSLRSYALIRTWPAPEIPRPGCVWSHVLLLAFAEIAQFSNLQTIASFATRPDSQVGMDLYSKAIRCSPNTVVADGVRVTPLDAQIMLRALYGSQATLLSSTRAGRFDNALFALWSQQWPRLRRTFSFRTAATQMESASGFRFDLKILVGKSADPLGAYKEDGPNWEREAIADVISDEPTDFRRFLWRYGSDLRRGMERYPFLATLFVLTRDRHLLGDQLESVFDAVARTLPLRDDGLLLKRDLLAFGEPEYSLLGHSDAIVATRYFLQRATRDSFPMDPGLLVNAVMAEWPKRREAVLDLAEMAADDTDFSKLLSEHISSVVAPNRFLEETREHLRLRRRMILLKPNLLDTNELTEVDGVQLNYLLALLPTDGDLATRVIDHLLSRSETDVANDMFDQHEHSTLVAIVRRVQRNAEEDASGRINPAWLHGLHQRTEHLLSGGYFELLQSTKGIASMARILGYDRKIVIDVGPSPWLLSLQRADDTIKGEDRQIFLAFLMALVLSHPVPGSELIFELAFDQLHSALAGSRLSDQARLLLIRSLPFVGWWHNWDSCLRLRVGVVKSYKAEHLSQASFARLTNDKKVMADLNALLRENTKDWEFLD